MHIGPVMPVAVGAMLLILLTGLILKLLKAKNINCASYDGL